MNDNEIFKVGEIIIYDYEFTAKIVKIHKDANLFDIILYHPKAGVMNKPTSVASSLCVKFYQL